MIHRKKESNNQDKKSPMLKKGTYPIISVHVELFRSNRSPSTKLTQIGCVVSNWNESSFFLPIKPFGLEKYLDNYKLGGDLLQALHMTKEDDGIYLFRSQFEIVDEDKKIICVEEKEALKCFLSFLENFPKCVILGVDEDSVSILVKKLKGVNKEKVKELVSGFTYWKRVLKYFDVDGYRTLDLEEYYSRIVAEDLPSFTTVSDIAVVLLKSVIEVTGENKRKDLAPDFYKLCKRIECLERPRKVEYDRKASVENVEVFNSFRPSVSATFSAEKLEQVTLSSESDSGPEEAGSCTREDVVVGVTENSTNPRCMEANGKKLDADLRNGEYWEDLETLTAPDIICLSPPPCLQITKRNSWQFGSTWHQNMGGTVRFGRFGTLVCPRPRCSAVVKFSNLSKHLKKLHGDQLVGLLCEVCNKVVLSSSVAEHMPICYENQSSSKPAEKHYILPGLSELPLPDNS